MPEDDVGHVVGDGAGDVEPVEERLDDGRNQSVAILSVSLKPALPRHLRRTSTIPAMLRRTKVQNTGEVRLATMREESHEKGNVDSTRVGS